MIAKENAEHYVWGEQCDGWHLVKQPGMSVIHESMPAGTQEARHYHTVARQFFFVLSGELTMEMEGEIQQLSRHQGIEIPPLAKHQARNESAQAVEFLVISHPTTRGDRVNVD